MDEFSGRVALVTGGARGICAHIVKTLAQKGALVIIADILDDEGAALASDVGGEYWNLDVRSESAWQNLSAHIHDKHGRLDILVNGAGILMFGGMAETSLPDFKKVMDITCDGTFLSIKHMMPLLSVRAEEVPYGAVVNISSIAAFGGTPNLMSYGASRAAMMSMTKSAALEAAALGHKIRVNSVHPSSVRTELTRGNYERLVDKGMTMDQAVNHMANLHPLRRIGTPDDITAAVLFLVSDQASWITGTGITLDGGRTA